MVSMVWFKEEFMFGVDLDVIGDSNEFLEPPLLQTVPYRIFEYGILSLTLSFGWRSCDKV